MVSHEKVPVALAGITRKPSMHRDPEIVVSSEEGQELANKLGIQYFDIDLTTPNSDIEEMMLYLARKVIRE